jgi:O-antigen ligase
MNLSLAIVLAAAGLVVLWLGWRRPTNLLPIVAASLAIGPQWILARYLRAGLLALAMPLHKGLLIVAMAAHAWHFGLRRGIVNWPLLAVVWLALQSLILADRDPRLTLQLMAFAGLDLMLPWILVHLVVAPGTRARYALLLALLAAGCVASGVALHLMDIRGAYYGSATRGLRLHGASNAGWLACLAFAGFAIALHEAVQRRHFGFAGLAAVNLVIAVLTGGRMGVGACLVLAVAYLGFAALPPLGGIDRRASLAFGMGSALGLLLLGASLVRGFGIENVDDALSLRARESIWVSHFEAFLESPIFGRGLGAGALGVNYYHLPHNEYLRLLVEGGVAGLVIYGGAVALWGRRVLALVAPGERGFVRALFLALAVYALTDNILTMVPALVPFLYLALILGEPEPGRSDAAAGSGASTGARAISDAPHAMPAPGPSPRRPGPGSATPR